MVSGTGTGDVEQVAFGVVALFQISVIDHCFDSILKRNDLVLAGHYDNSTELQAFGQMHGADGNVAAGCLKVVVQQLVWDY